MCLSGCGDAVQRALLAVERVVGAEIYLAEQRVRVVFEGSPGGGLRQQVHRRPRLGMVRSSYYFDYYSLPYNLRTRCYEKKDCCCWRATVTVT